MMQRVVIITGASKGIGESLAYLTNKKFNENTLFILISRDLNKLERVKNEMLAEKSPNIAFSNKIITLSHDFSKNISVAECTSMIKSLIRDEKLNFVTELYVFYNHGTLQIATIERVADSALNEFQINVASIWVLMATIRQLFPLNLVPTQFHVNISSLWATKLQESCSVYNATRSARATMFKCLALEQPFLRVFNYQPGPVYTDMQRQLYENNVQIYESYRSDYDEGKLVTPEATVKKLLDIIDKNQFENGAALDFYDP